MKANVLSVKPIMRLHTLKIFLLFVFTLAFVKVKAQEYTCEGALGDPVVSETFGAGVNNPGPATTGTDMMYVRECPEDGQYTLVNNVNFGDGNNCRPGGGWRLVPHDHTGDVNGYMMLINASFTPSVFFTKITPPVLCGNTIYEFSAYVLNLIPGAGGIQPNLKFSIEAIDGTPLVLPRITGDIPPSTSVEDWVRESLTFKTRATDNQVVLKITNQAPGGGGNDLLLDDINFRACGPIIQRGFTSIDDAQPKNQCINESKSYTVKEELGPGYTNPKVQWQQNIDGSGWIDIPNATSSSYSFAISSANARVYQYRLAAAEGDNINTSTCKVFSDPLSITVNEPPVVPDIPPSSACEDDAVTITAAGGVSYEWTGPGITAANKNQNPLVFNNVTTADEGTYNVTVTSAGGCSSAKSTTLTVNTKPVIPGSFDPLSICVGASTQLDATTPGNVVYSWTPTTGLSDPTIANPIATPADTTTYTVKVSDVETTDCFTTKSITVNVLSAPTANAGNKKKIFEGQSVTLDATAKNGDIYSWTPADYLSDPTALNPVATPHEDIKYTLTVQSIYHCGMDTSSVFVRVFKKVVIPNTFSPNADGVNDTWQIEALETYPQSLITVFNRYGQQVFKSIGYSKPWKGTYNGKALPPGTYYYTIDLKNDTPKLTGWVLLVQ